MYMTVLRREKEPLRSVHSCYSSLKEPLVGFQRVCRQIAPVALIGVLVSGQDFAAAAAATPEEKAATQSEEQRPEGKRRPVRELLYGATPEEQARLTEERKRISAAAAAFGTDPTAIVGYYELTYGHTAFTNNLRTDRASAEVRLPITPNWLYG